LGFEPIGPLRVHVLKNVVLSDWASVVAARNDDAD
jgi:hypothetical protein